MRLCHVSPQPTVRALPARWMAELLERIARQPQALTVNRRSAGLPFLVRAHLRAAKGSPPLPVSATWACGREGVWLSAYPLAGSRGVAALQTGCEAVPVESEERSWPLQQPPLFLVPSSAPRPVFSRSRLTCPGSLLWRRSLPPPPLRFLACGILSAMFRSVFDGLCALVSPPSADELARVHALNVLRSLLLDRALLEDLAPYVEDTLELLVRQLHSACARPPSSPRSPL